MKPLGSFVPVALGLVLIADASKCARALFVLSAAFVGVVSWPMTAHGAALGERYTYTDQTGRQWCATANAFDIGVDGLAWAWLTIDADPRRAVHMPMSTLGVGCTK
jgi:hypothetical protein